MKKLALTALLLLCCCLSSSQRLVANVPCSLPFNLQNNTVADATQVMANYNAIITCLGSAAAAGVNSDITRLNGLSTPLSPSEGGTGQTCCYAVQFGVKTDGVTDDTAAWNSAISFMNVNPGTTMYASPGTSKISALNALTANSSYIRCVGSPGTCILSHSSGNALQWNAGAKGGGLQDMGLQNTGGGCSSTVLISGSAQQQEFLNIVLSPGISTLATIGVTAGNAGGLTTWQNLYSPQGVANVACGLFILNAGAGLTIQNSTLFVSAGTSVAGRNLITADIAGSTSYDSMLVQNSLFQYFYHIFSSSLTAANATLLDGKFEGNFFDNCIHECFNVSVAAGVFSAFSITNNWMDNDVGASNCNTFSATGGVLIGLQFNHNRVLTCGASGITVSGTSPIYGISITDNQIYDVNSLNTGTTYGILVKGDGSDGIFHDIIVTGNSVSADFSGVFTPYHNPTYGIGYGANVAGGAGAQRLIIANNIAIGSTAGCIAYADIVNSVVSNNVGCGSTGGAPTTQKFLSGSGTYTTPVGVSYIHFYMVGGGGGGQGSGTTPGPGGTGGATTFGTALLSASGGLGGGNGGTGGACAGTASIASVAGAHGQGSSVQTNRMGGSGGPTAYGGAGGGGDAGAVGFDAVANTGAGGGGAGASGTAGEGKGGGAGCYMEGLIGPPAATYAYAVGAAGTAGGAGTGGFAGGLGGSGYLVVEEHYGN